MVDIVLVYPRTSEVEGGFSCPLGIEYIASYLMANGVDVKIIDMSFKSWKEYEDELRELQPEFIGFSIQTPIAKQGMKAVAIAKKVSPKSKIIIGGAHPTVDKENVKNIRDVDFIVLGEGERTILDIVNKKIKSRIVSGKAVENLDDLPFPERSMINDRYIRMNKTVEMIVSRGCPYNCLFCQPTQRKLFGDKTRMRSPKNVADEVRKIKEKYGNVLFYFLDDTFTWDFKWLERFCRLVRPMNIIWKCNTRVNLIDEKKLAMMKKSGCIFINYGVESGSQDILNFMRKGITVQQIKDAFKATHKIGLLCHAFLIIGTPTETKADLDKTVSLVKEIHPDGIQVSIMTPLIGTDLEKYCKEKRIVNVKSFSDYHYCMNDYPIKLEHLTKKDLQDYKKTIYDVWKSSNRKNYSKYLKLSTDPRIFKIYYNSMIKRLLG